VTGRFNCIYYLIQHGTNKQEDIHGIQEHERRKYITLALKGKLHFLIIYEAIKYCASMNDVLLLH
jgi:hypothetical protein